MGRCRRVVVAALLAWTLGLPAGAGAARAFHRGGAGACNGCHSIHSPGAGAGNLLQGTDASSICLNCHAGMGGPAIASVFSPDGSAMTPGGDFYWLTKDFVWAGGASPGEGHGHNVVAQDFGLIQDVSRSQAPGGSYPSAALGCTSCHDPHGRVGGGTASGGLPISGSGSYGDVAGLGTATGNYRLLGDSRYGGGGLASGFTFVNDAPVAVQAPLSPFGESDTAHVAYGSGMSEWCVNCHASYQTNEHSTFKHPAGDGERLVGGIVGQYNTYIRTGDLSGTGGTAYLQFVPFEWGTADPTQLEPNSTQGPNATANVMCLTCHRAHASAFRATGRWDFDAALLADSHPAAGDAGAAANDPLYSYYGRDIVAEFGSGQKPFCEKCHAASGP